MKPCPHLCTVFGTALLVTVVFCTTSGQQVQPPSVTALAVGSARISQLKGEVTLLGPQGNTLTGQTGLVLPAESTIETRKGSALLELQDDSQVLVKPNSHVVLKAPDQGRGFYLELLLGKVVNKVVKRMGNTPSFRMGTPTAVITVRGTRFEVEVTKKLRTYVAVYEGLVAVQGLAGGAPPILLQPGFVTDVDPEGEPSRPREIGELGRRNDRQRGGGSIAPFGLDGEGQQNQRNSEHDGTTHSGPDN